MKITVIGLGYVGLANALLLAQNNDVVGVDTNSERIEKLNSRISPLDDTDIREFLATTSARWSTDFRENISASELIILALPTNYDAETGALDTSIIERSVREIRKKSTAPILIKSTLPIHFIETFREKLLSENFAKNQVENIIFSPEFLREGHALHDNLFPSRIIVGDRGKLGKIVTELFAKNAKNDPDL